MRRPVLALTAACGALLAAALPSAALADTLREALAMAYRTNPQLHAARANQRVIDENVVIERAAGRPQASASAQYTEYVKQSNGDGIGPDRGLGAGLDLSLPLFTGGAIRNGILAAETRVEAGRADLRGAESALFTQVVAAYMDVIRGEALVGLAANQVDVLSVNAQATGDRFEIGDLTRTDVAQSEARLAVAQGDLRSAEANLVAARERYIALVGKAPDNLQPPPPLPNMPADVQTAVAIALENNPDLIAARQRARAAGYDIDIAGAGRMPRVSVFTGGSYNNYFGSLGNDSTVGLPQSATAAQAGVRVSMPILQGGRVGAQERQAQARAQGALEQEIALERDVIAEVRSAWSSWQASLAIVESSQTAVSAAALGLEGVRAENTVGNRTILEILNQEQELVNTRVQLITARRNAYVAGFALLAAMGRAEARDLGLGDDGPLYDPVINYDRVQGKWWDWERDPDPVAQSTRTIDITAPDAEIPPESGTGRGVY